MVLIVPNIINSLDAFTKKKFVCPSIKKVVIDEFNTCGPSNILVDRFHKIPRGKLIDVFEHNLPSFDDVVPKLGPTETLMLFLGKPIQNNPLAPTTLWGEHHQSKTKHRLHI